MVGAVGCWSCPRSAPPSGPASWSWRAAGSTPATLTIAARSCASLVTLAALSPPTARSPSVPGCAACSSASRCSGTLVGEVIVAAAPGTKLNPVITPPVLTVTSAVACCHHGFLTERTGTTSPLRRLQSRCLAWFGFPARLRSLASSRSSRCAARACYPPDAGRLLRIAWTCGLPGLSAFWNSTPACCGDPRRGAAHPLLEDVAHQRRLARRRRDRRGAPGRVARPGDELRRARVALAVGRLALQAGLDERAAARRRSGSRR